MGQDSKILLQYSIQKMVFEQSKLHIQLSRSVFLYCIILSELFFTVIGDGHVGNIPRKF